MGAYAPDDVKAQARAMIVQGMTPRQIGPQIGVPWRTIYGWIDNWQHDEALEEEDRRQLSREYRISQKADVMIEDAIDNLSLEEAKKNLVPLNAIAGTYRDKIMRRKERGTGVTPQQFVLVTAQPGSNVQIAVVDQPQSNHTQIRE